MGAFCESANGFFCGTIEIGSTLCTPAHIDASNCSGSKVVFVNFTSIMEPLFVNIYRVINIF